MPIHSTTRADHRPPVEGCSLHPRDCGDLTNWRHPSGASIACGSIACGDGVETWEVWYAGDEEPTKWQTREQIVARLAATPQVYGVAYVNEAGGWDIVETFTAASHDEANDYAAGRRGDDDWYVLDSVGRNINGGPQ